MFLLEGEGLWCFVITAQADPEAQLFDLLSFLGHLSSYATLSGS